MSTKVFQVPFISLTKNLKVHAIVQRNPTAENNAPKDYPNLKHYTSLDALLQDPELDVVVVSTPPNTHYEFASKSLKAGKHVLVEKPFVPTSAQAQELVDLAKANNKLICVYQNRRWDIDFLTVKKLLKAGTLGRIYEFESHYDRYRPEKPTTWKGTLTMSGGGGVIFDLGAHLLDQVYVLFGMPGSISAKFADQRAGKLLTGEGPEEPDSVTVVMSYPKQGLIVHVRMAIMSVETKQTRFWIRGTKGSFHKHGLDPQEDLLKAGWKGNEPGFGVEDASNYGTITLAKEDGSVVEETYPAVEPETYSKIFEGFGNALASGKEEDVPVPATQAVEVLKIIEGVKEAARTGKDYTF